MKLQDQVCTLEQAKRLKELGIEQNTSYFSWLGNVDYEPDLKSDDGNNYAAFTVAELGMMLTGFEYEAYGFNMFFSYYQYDRKMWASSFRNPVHFENKECFAKTQSESMAMLLIHLLENKLTTAEECNKRLTQ